MSSRDWARQRPVRIAGEQVLEWTSLTAVGVLVLGLVGMLLLLMWHSAPLLRMPAVVQLPDRAGLALQYASHPRQLLVPGSDGQPREVVALGSGQASRLLRPPDARLQLLEDGSLRLLAPDAVGETAGSVVKAEFVPNQSGWGQRLRFAFHRVSILLLEGPAAGGLFPALVGTVLLVLLMSTLVAPLGVLVAFYLVEFARPGRFNRAIRLTISNLAGVPSVVYGVFGLGIFVNGLGAGLDTWLFADQLPTPTFGSGGLLWAALTLALLTLPVVVVATEEGLARIPRELRNASLALGATPTETVLKLVFPMARPALVTGVILAIARATSEVAPLMLVGVVALAPALPVDGDAPFLHPSRQFMHLGHQVYELGMQGAALSETMAWSSALLLLLLVLALNAVAMAVRERLRRRHALLDTGVPG